MERRKFIGRLSLLGLGMGLSPALLQASSQQGTGAGRWKQWLWMTPETGLGDDEWKKRFEKIRAHHFDGVIPQIYASHQALYQSEYLPVREPLLERLIRIGRETGLEVHAWMWTMINNNPWYVEHHPEFYSVNGLGQPSHSHPAYVGYYRFMCPNQAGVQEFLKRNVAELSRFDHLDGVHLDYIRMPDVIIAEALQPRYNVVQDREYPEFDYCYCDRCRSLFREKTGIDPSKDLADPSASDQWRQFRYDSITRLVNEDLAPIPRKEGKKVTAAVFPNWEGVRQQWSNWELDAYFPMLYHNFYNADLQWIADHAEKQTQALKNPVPVYAGLFMPALSEHELKETLEILKGTLAAGVSLFSYHSIREAHWEVLKEFSHTNG